MRGRNGIVALLAALALACGGGEEAGEGSARTGRVDRPAAEAPTDSAASPADGEPVEPVEQGMPKEMMPDTTEAAGGG